MATPTTASSPLDSPLRTLNAAVSGSRQSAVNAWTEDLPRRDTFDFRTSGSVMGTTDARGPTPGRSAVVLALRRYGRELMRLRLLALPALLLPAVGNIGIRYVAPL